MRDYSKTKNISIFKFLRTPVIIFLIDFVLKRYNINNSIIKAMIFERWIFLVLKMNKKKYKMIY